MVCGWMWLQYRDPQEEKKWWEMRPRKKNRVRWHITANVKLREKDLLSRKKRTWNVLNIGCLLLGILFLFLFVCFTILLAYIKDDFEGILFLKGILDSDPCYRMEPEGDQVENFRNAYSFFKGQMSLRRQRRWFREPSGRKIVIENPKSQGIPKLWSGPRKYKCWKAYEGFKEAA